jgi:hypothetical protein
MVAEYCIHMLSNSSELMKAFMSLKDSPNDDYLPTQHLSNGDRVSSLCSNTRKCEVNAIKQTRIKLPPLRELHTMCFGTPLEFNMHSVCSSAHIKAIICFLISNFRRVLYVVCFLLGNSPASEFYMPTFRNTICSIFIGK